MKTLLLTVFIVSTAMGLPLGDFYRSEGFMSCLEGVNSSGEETRQQSFESFQDCLANALSQWTAGQQQSRATRGAQEEGGWQQCINSFMVAPGSGQGGSSSAGEGESGSESRASYIPILFHERSFADCLNKEEKSRSSQGGFALPNKEILDKCLEGNWEIPSLPGSSRATRENPNPFIIYIQAFQECMSQFGISGTRLGMRRRRSPAGGEWPGQNIYNCAAQSWGLPDKIPGLSGSQQRKVVAFDERDFAACVSGSSGSSGSEKPQKRAAGIEEMIPSKCMEGMPDWSTWIPGGQGSGSQGSGSQESKEEGGISTSGGDSPIVVFTNFINCMQNNKENQN